MKMTPTSHGQSSVFSAHGYDPDTRTMALSFTSGKTYHYAGVPQQAYDTLIAAKSMGSHFVRHMQAKYRVIRGES